MSNNIPDTIFQKFCTLSQKVQRIQNQVQQEEVTPEKRVQLHKELEGLQENVEALRQNALSAQKQAKQLFSQFEEIEGQIISLYREVEEGFEKFEISLISKEAMDLSQFLAKGKMLEVAKRINGLRHNVHFLFKHRRPSLKNRKIVHLALKITDCAGEILSKPDAISKQQLQLIQLLKTLLKEAVFQAETVAWSEEGELAMELYEIADLLHRRKEEGRVRLHLIRSSLTPAQRARLDAALDYPKELVKVLLEIADGDPCSQWQQKPPSVIHVLQQA